MVRAGDGTLSPVELGRGGRRGRRGPAQGRRRGRGAGGGGTSNEEGWLVAAHPPRRSALRTSTARPTRCSRACWPSCRGPSWLADGRPRLRRGDPGDRHRPAARDADPRPADPQGGRGAAAPSCWSPPSARPRSTAAPPRSPSATRRARPPPSLGALAAALGVEGYEAGGPHAKAAEAIAEALRSVPDPIIVWGERLWREPGRGRAPCSTAPGPSSMHQRIGPGLLEVPEEANGRGLRESGCLPGAGPGLRPTGPGKDAAAIRDGLPRRASSSSTPTRSAPTRTATPGRKALAGDLRRLVRDVRRRVDQPRQHRLPGRDPCREGGHRHPPRRPPAARCAPTSRHPRAVRPAGSPGRARRRARRRDRTATAAEDVFETLCSEVPFYGGPDATRRSAAGACAGRNATRRIVDPSAAPGGAGGC